uniref:SANT domain-containing protein n=1 Tax=Globodera pallida TaxID=36090 RepID=A0A183C5E4_GLOPA
MTAQNNDFLREILKAQMQMASFEGGLHNQQATKTPKELSRRRPSLMHDSGSSVIAHNDVLRPAQLLPATDNKKMLHHQLSLSTDTNFIGQTALPDSQEEEDEKQKRMLSERLDKIERERIQATNAQKNAQKKMRACEAVLRQEPLMLAEEGKGSVADSDEEEADELSPADALIERIYAENRRKASEIATNMSSTGPLGSHLPMPMANVNNARLMAEDAARLEEEFERGVLLLPTLVQAMRIQRERRQDALENRRIIYEEQLTLWERKVAVFERSPKKMAKDLRHRELFEKTFVELRKLREEKERNTRVERSRFSLAQGGNGIPIAPSETLLHFVSNNNNSSELPASEQGDNDGESVHEKAFAAAIVPPTYMTKPRRFFDNRNSIVDNPLADACAQLETLQNQWADLEKEVFMEKIAIYGKNFAAIAAFLPSKNVKECVQFYYMTKKRNNYKQKIGRRRKKIGRQGYQPPVMPRFGDSDENVQLRNYGRGGTYVECLLCSARILVLESLSQQSPHEQPFDHHFGPALVSSSSQQQLQQQIPICSNCQKQELRNRQLNRCPLGSCACVSGKRKMRPVRNVPEKFASLSIERKRFLISRLKIPPSTNKCCTNCFKRITKDIDGLLVGELETELEEFNNRAMVHTGNAKVEPCLISEKIDEETENMVETKSELGEEVCTTGMEGPPVKEMKLEMKQEEEEFEEGLLDEVVVKTVPMETETNVTEDPLRPRFGSLTKGTPNRRQRSTLLGTWGGPSFRTAENRQMTDEFPLVPNFAKAFSEQQNSLYTD